MWFTKNISKLAFLLSLVCINVADIRIAPEAKLALKKRSVDTIHWCDVFYQEDFPPNTSCEGKDDNVWDYFPACCNGAYNCRSGFIWDVYLCAPLYVYDPVQNSCVKLEGNVCPYVGSGTTIAPTTEPTIPTSTEVITTEVATTVTEDTSIVDTTVEDTTIVTEDPTTVETTTEGVTTETTEEDTTIDQTTTEEPTTVLPGTTDSPIISCKSLVNGKLPHPTDCTKYILCTNSNPTVHDCLEGYIFYVPFKTCLVGIAETCELYHLP